MPYIRLVHSRASARVSILVLLDMALMPGRSRGDHSRLSGFNPCFTGYGSDAWCQRRRGCYRVVVSILVLLDMALMRKEHDS